MTNTMKSSLLILCLSLFCGYDIYGQKLIVGEVIDTVICQNYPSQSYSLYLPTSYYDSSNAHPVVFIFDPMGRGSTPVKLFQQAAEKFDYVVLGSNNSRNGSWDIAFDAAEAMLDEALTRYHIDTTRMYTSGFSGGSRVATTIAVLSKSVAGVIGCGAGFSNISEYRPSPADDFSYVGIVGNMDMNYQEHIRVEQELGKVGINNLLLIFEGRHHWPQPEQIDLAFHWLELQAKNKGLNNFTTWTFQLAYKAFKHRADSILASNELVLAAQAYEQILEDFYEYSALSDVRNALAEIRSLKEYKKQFKNYERINKFEKEYQQKIGVAFSEAFYTKLQVKEDSLAKGPNWWYKEINLLNKMAKTGRPTKRYMGERLLNLIWAKFATASFNFAEQKDFESAISFNKVWVYAQPTSVWALWSRAKLLAQNGNVSEALDFLEKAHQNGMSRPQSVTGYREFDTLKGHERYKELMAKLNQSIQK